jgi:modulator of FtsH protease
MADWSGFFQAELGAAAALAGLVIVAISINVSRILADPSLPGRAAETLVSPSGVLIACSFALVPHQPAWVLGLEIAATGLVMASAPAFILFRVLRSGTKVARGYVAGRTILASLSCLPFIVSGALICAGAPDALYWMVPGVIVSLLATVLNAWVLLVEILR